MDRRIARRQGGRPHRAEELTGRGAPQLRRAASPNYALPAPKLRRIATQIFAADPTTLGAGYAWFGLACFTLQIYFDFAGYSDMAIGLARMFGIPLKENFNAPYISRSITEFWQRWHISLTTWIRDYLYIPLGGNRGSEFLTYRN